MKDLGFVGLAVVGIAALLAGCESPSGSAKPTSNEAASPLSLVEHGMALTTGKLEGGVAKTGFVQDIEGLAIKNDEFRRVLYTSEHSQLVVMALKPKEEIGFEVHELDQFFRVEEGSGEAVVSGIRTTIRAGFAVFVPAGVRHNIINTGTASLKLYTVYSPPNHRDGVVHHTRDEAEGDKEHFDGKTTE